MTSVIEGSHQVIEAKQMRQNWIVREDKFCGVSFFHPLIHDKNIQIVLEGENLDFYFYSSMFSPYFWLYKLSATIEKKEN